MTWLFESPAVPLFSGALLFAVAAAFWVQTRHRNALIGCAAVVGVTLAWLLVQHFVVTEAEQIKATIREIATRLEDNDVEGVVALISESNPELVQEVRTVMQLGEVQRVSIKRNLQATTTSHRGGLSGQATFNAVATVKPRRGDWGQQPIPRFVVVQLRKENGKWRVRSYEAKDPREGM